MFTPLRSRTRLSRPDDASQPVPPQTTSHRIPILARGILAGLAAIAVAAAPAGAANPAAGGMLRGAATGSIGIRLVDAPVSAKDDPRARVYIVDHLNPGAVITRRVEVSNTTASTARIALYPAAASIEEGSFLGGAGHAINDLSTWTTVTPAEPDVPAGGKLMATVTITVPADAAPGEQYGVIWAEARSADSGGGGVTQVSRVGIRLYVSVGPGGAPAANFSIDSLRAERSASGEPTVVASVKNTGGRALDMNGSLELNGGPGGLNAGPFPASLGTTLAIGATAPVTIVLDKALPAGPWDARITLKSGLVEQSADATITFPASGSSAAVATNAEKSGLPKAALALVGAGVVLALGFVGFRRRRTSGIFRNAAALRETRSLAEPAPLGPVIDLRPTVLICDDEADIRLLYRRVMEATGAIVVEAGDGEECLTLAATLEPDLVFLDLVLPGKSGFDVLVELRRRHPKTAVVVMSGVLSDPSLDRSRQLGAAESIEKLGLVARIPELVERYRHTAA
jgi:CheY-like chemotaxis protein